MKLIFAVLWSSVLLVGCESVPTVNTEGAPGKTLADYKTYRWFLEPERDPEVNPMSNLPEIYKHVQASVDREMAAKGYRKTEGKMADLQLGFLIVVKKGMDTSIMDEYFGSTSEEAITEVGARIPGMRVDDYEKGSLVLDFRDDRTEEFVWRGAFDTNIKPDRSLEQTKARIDEAVTAIFASVPEEG